MKKMYKIELIDKKCEKDIFIELSLLSRIHHPFIVNIHFAFQDSDYLYLISDSLKEGKYPNYEAVIPKENPNILTIGRDEFLKSIRRLGNYSSQSTFQVRLTLSDKGLELTAEDMDFSYKGSESITCDYQGEPMEIGFNSRFLREMVENLDVDVIQMSFSKPTRAALITPVNQQDENEDVLMLIMPVMLNSSRDVPWRVSAVFLKQNKQKENRVVAAARLRKVRATQSTILPNGKAHASATDSATETIPPACG